jgi:hypothetical protein
MTSDFAMKAFFIRYPYKLQTTIREVTFRIPCNLYRATTLVRENPVCEEISLWIVAVRLTNFDAGTPVLGSEGGASR